MARGRVRPPSGPHKQHSMARQRGQNTATQQVHMVIEVDFHLAYAHVVLWQKCMQLAVNMPRELHVHVDRTLSGIRYVLQVHTHVQQTTWLV